MKPLVELLSPDSTVSLFELRKYLEANGWFEQPIQRGKWVIYGQPTEQGGRLELALPKSDELLDAGRLKVDALNVLAQMQNRELSVVTTEAANFARDAQQFRITNVDSAENISLESAQKYVRGLKNLFLYGACSEVKPKPFYEQPIQSALERFEEFRFGHTFKGSFGFTVYSYAIQQHETPDIHSQSPLSRRVAVRLARGLQLLQASVERNDAGILAGAYEVALNAKMCDALVEMTNEGESDFECSFAWAAALDVEPELKGLRPFRIGRRETEVLEYVAEALKVVEPEAQTFIGLVTNLHCPKNPGEEGSRRAIEVKGRHSEHGTLNVHMALGTRRYLAAIEAHKSGSKIRVFGKLSRKGTRWSMTEIKEFGVIDA